MGPVSVPVALVGLLCASIVPGCMDIGGQGKTWVRVYADNSTTHDAAFRIVLNDGEPVIVDLPDEGMSPNVRVAFEGHVTGRSLSVAATETYTRAQETREFGVEAENYIIVSIFSNGSLDIRHRSTEPFFD